MTYSLSEIITKKAQTLVEPLAAHLRKNPVYIYQVSGSVTTSCFLSKASAYTQMEMIRAMAASELNEHEIEREDYHDLDNRLDRLVLKDGRVFEISQHRIIW
ncbi:hypothetical protein ACP6H1_27455 [Vibrio harveyi]|uniref:hypothetical protein n=1 Tax=Vibrio harveyi TaxID=669 RepID=UPI003CE799C0